MALAMRLVIAASRLGATINRLEYAADNLANVSQNTSASTQPNSGCRLCIRDH